MYMSCKPWNIYISTSPDEWAVTKQASRNKEVISTNKCKSIEMYSYENQ